MSKIADRYRLSPLQRGMLFNTLYAPGSGVDVVQLVCTFPERLDVPAFRRAWQGAVERHPALRTSFRWRGLDEPLQDVHGAVELPFEERDLSGLSVEMRKQAILAYLKEDRKRGFDLSVAPLVRLSLFHIGDGGCHVVLSFHHIVLDGRSVPVLFHEVADGYEAFISRLEPDLPGGRPYRDFVDWMFEPKREEDETFWRRELLGFKAPTPLVVDRLPRAEVGEEGEHGLEETRLTAEATSRLRALGQQHGVSINTFLYGAWALLLSRYSGEKDVVFGTVRTLLEPTPRDSAPAVGLFLNTVPVRARPRDDSSLLSWLSELQQAQWLALREKRWRTSLVDIEASSEVPRGTSLFESIVIYENFLIESILKSQGRIWSTGSYRFHSQISYPLRVHAYLGPELLLEIGYEKRRFERATIARMLGHLATLLEEMGARPEAKLPELSLLTNAERDQLLSWSGAEETFPDSDCVQELIEAQATRTPDAVALSFEGASLTYAELNRRANRLAHHLMRLGVGPETPVAICVQRSPEMVVGLLGILKAGGAYVPLDPSHPRERLAFMLEDSRATLVLTEEVLLSRLPSGAAGVVLLDRDEDAFAHESGENPPPRATPENLVYIIYTSGSFGRPKGVELSHGALCNFLHAMRGRPGFTDRDRFLALTTLSFDPSTLDLLLPLTIGACVVIASRETAFDPARLISLLEREDPSVLQATPTTWRMLLDAGWRGKASLKMLCGAEPLTGDLARRLLERGASLWNLYGPTETTVWSAIHHVQSADDPIPIGSPIPNVRMYVLDPCLDLVPVGIPGELHIGGKGLARGYRGLAEMTRERFISNPYDPLYGARLYKSGDLARRLPDGALDFLGRSDNQVKIRGFRIEIEEIESVLEGHPDVQRAAVTARDESPGDRRLVAYVVSKRGEPLEDSSPLAARLRSYLEEKLPDYMVPSRFVVLEAIPLTPSGKIDRRSLPPLDTGRPLLPDRPIPPRDDVERRLAELWEKVLGVSKIGVRDDFFELGGHSLLAVRLFAEIERAFGENLSLASLLEAPTIERQADLLRGKESPRLSRSLVMIQRGGSKPPFFCVHGLGGNVLHYRLLARHLGADRPFYGLQPRGLNRDHPPDRSIEEMALHYLDEIRTVQPRGPYLLIGGSFGGLVAFEMARQLHASGDEVSLLVMLHTWAPGFPRPRPNPTAFPDPIYRLGIKIRRRYARLRAAAPGDRLRAAQHILARDAREAWRQTRLRLGGSPDSVFGHLLPPALIATQLALREARSRYAPDAYAGAILLLRDAEDRPDALPAPGLGWEGLVRGGIEVHDIPGRHIEMYEEPAVRLVARHILLGLERGEMGGGR